MIVTTLTAREIRSKIIKYALEKGIHSKEGYEKIEKEILSKLSDDEITRYNVYYHGYNYWLKEGDCHENKKRSNRPCTGRK